MSRLLQSSLQPSSIPTYSRAWRLFSTFFHTVFPGVEISLPFSPPTIALFISYLFERNYAVSTVTTYISALGYFHKLHGYADPGKNFIICQMMKGYAKIDTRVDNRLPITLPILHRLVSSSLQLTCSGYNISLFQAMCLFAFHTFSRIGEITQNQSNHNVQFHQLSAVLNSKNEVLSFKFTFYDYKHSYNQRPFTLNILPSNVCCPVQYLVSYLKVRGNSPGPLFRMADTSPVSRAYFSSTLSTVLKFCSMDPTRYKGHSFRIGAASNAADKGLSDAQIRVLGRWRSNAFRKYIRVESLS